MQTAPVLDNVIPFPGRTAVRKDTLRSVLVLFVPFRSPMAPKPVLSLRKDPKPTDTSRYRGAYFHGTHKSWYANVGVYLGRFSSEIKAAEAVAEHEARLRAKAC
jgi:hypothetical protein